MTLLIALIILSVLILVHELGHFWAAKKSGILVEEFGIGYPPRAFAKKIGETIYSINWLPIGGFVKLYGEDAVETGEGGVLSSRAFWAQTKFKRFLVLIAGVTMNFLLAALLFGGVYTAMGIPTETDVVKVVGVLDGSPAYDAGMQNEDVVEMVDGVEIYSTQQFVDLINQKKGSQMEIVIRGEEGVYGKTVMVEPRENPPEGEGALGVVVSSVEMKQFVWWQMPFRGIAYGVKEAVAWGGAIAVGIYMMLKNLLVSGVVPQDVAGPVGIFQLTSSAAQAGFLSLIQFAGILSVNLAILNILPFPALDGGRLVFLGIEVITGKKVGGRIERWTHGLGMLILLFLMLLVTLNDVVRVTNSGTLLGLLRKIMGL